MKKKICFIIVIYRPDQKLLDRNLKILRDYQVQVIDNRKTNLGYAGGNNLGAKQALDGGTEWLVILNDDLELNRSEINSFCQFLAKSKPNLIGPYKGSFDSKRWSTILDQSKPSKGAETYLSGSFLAVNRKVIEKLGTLFYDPYFLFYEDAELSIKAKRAGFSLLHHPLKKLIHHASSSTVAGSPLQQYYLARNHLLFVERNAPLAVKLRELIRLPKTIFKHWQKKEFSALEGIWDYLLRRFGQRRYP